MSSNLFDPDFVGPRVPGHVFKSEIRTFNNWGEFVEAATQHSLTFGQKLGLLHDCFNVEMGHRAEYDFDQRRYPPYTESERLKFLFEVADGWASSSENETRRPWPEREPQYHLGDRDRYDRPVMTAESEARQKLARKAFEVLSANWFSIPWWKNEGEAYHRKEKEEEWLNNFVSGRRDFDLVRQFFRPEPLIRNLSHHHKDRPHAEKTAVTFLLRLPKALWSWKPQVVFYPESGETETGRAMRKKREEEIQAVMKARVAESKVWIIEILQYLGELQYLGKWLMRLERPCVAKLTEIALRYKLETHLPKEQRVRDLHEACFAGSQAAWLLEQRQILRLTYAKLLWNKRLFQREESRIWRNKKRLDAIAEAERQKEEAERKLESLKK